MDASMTTWSASKKQKPLPEGITQQSGKNNTQNTTSILQTAQKRPYYHTSPLTSHNRMRTELDSR
uniref:Uncharacterized protein n=1 Tax=Arion vulgaris TaxID=1028688 RepID=A0A0B7B697_9EUPU